MTNNKIGALISALRKAEGMTQKELAQRLNVSDKAVSRWENGDSYPDLLLIPVIAEIFGISTDELFNGEIKRKDGINSEIRPKNIEPLLIHSLLKYKNKTIITIGIALFGLTIAIIVNFAALKSTAAFCIALSTTVISAICNALFTNQTKMNITSVGEKNEKCAEYIRKLNNKTVLIYCSVFSILLICLPLAVEGKPYYGLDFMSWFYPALTITALYYIALISTNSMYCLKSKRTNISENSKQNAKLKLKTTAIGIGVILLTLISMLILNDTDIYTKGIVFDSLEEFYAFMEEYKPDAILSECQYEEKQDATILDNAGNVILTYPYNEFVPEIRWNEGMSDTPESYFPCTIYTTEDYERVGTIKDAINSAFIIVLIIEMVMPFVVYFKKRNARE